jgi:hypothetical protein
MIRRLTHDQQVRAAELCNRHAACRRALGQVDYVAQSQMVAMVEMLLLTGQPQQSGSMRVTLDGDQVNVSVHLGTIAA